VGACVHTHVCMYACVCIIHFHFSHHMSISQSNLCLPRFIAERVSHDSEYSQRFGTVRTQLSRFVLVEGACGRFVEFRSACFCQLLFVEAVFVRGTCVCVHMSECMRVYIYRRELATCLLSVRTNTPKTALAYITNGH